MTLVPDQVSRWIPGTYVIWGTDGFGRSDSRSALRRFFETDTGSVVVATLSALAKDGAMTRSVVDDALDRYGIDPEKPDPAAQHR